LSEFIQENPDIQLAWPWRVSIEEINRDQIRFDPEWITDRDKLHCDQDNWLFLSFNSVPLRPIAWPTSSLKWSPSSSFTIFGNLLPERRTIYLQPFSHQTNQASGYLVLSQMELFALCVFRTNSLVFRSCSPRTPTNNCSTI